MSKSNKCPIDSSSSNEKDFRQSYYPYHQHNHYNTSHNKAESPLSHICKYLDVSETRKSSNENVELALEVEINESLKHILTKASRNSSDLLDVTIIRPSDSETTHETTVALYKDEVRDFISLVEQHHKHNSDEPRSYDERKESKRNDVDGENNRKVDAVKQPSRKDQKTEGKVKKDYYTQDVHNHKVQDKDAKIEEDPKQVYATINTFDKLRQALPCQNKTRQESDKPGTPCMCQHCGVVGVLVQSQKGPVAPFPPVEETNVAQQPPRNTTCRVRESTPTRKDPRQRRTVDIRKKKSIDQLDLLREINARIKSLEKRIAVQEETAVPRDYLKHILHKVLTQYNVKSNALLKNNATQYSTKSIAEVKTQQKSNANSDKLKDTRNKCYQVHTVLEEHQNWIDCSENNNKVSNGNVEKPKSSKDLYWFWGEEVVKPGCDLKTKILKLLDDKLTRKVHHNRSTSSTVPKPETTHQHCNRSENVTSNITEGGIKIERDENTIFLNNVDQSIKDFNHLFHGTHLASNNSTKEESICSKSTRAPTLPSNENKFSNLRNMSPKPNYPFDVKKTLDDSTFKRNIEVHKEKNKEKFQPATEEVYHNSYAYQSLASESITSMDYVLQQLKYNERLMESGLVRNKQAQIDTKFRIPKAKEIPGSLMKDNLHHNCLRVSKEKSPTTGSVDIKFVNPRIKHWSEESTTSEDKFTRQTCKPIPERKEPVALERKESLIYKLDFLKNLAKNKSTDQSRVLNKIWNQAKNTAKSKKDAVYIKIPFKHVNTFEAQDNLIEMHLTLEELETVVKSAKGSPSSNNVRVQSYKSSSDIDFGQRKHEEMKYANRELLRRRQLSAKGNKHRERR